MTFHSYDKHSAPENVAPFLQPRVATLALSLMLSLPTLTAHSQQAVTPPTIDPTYGLTLPKTSHTRPKRATDAKWIWADRTADAQTVALRSSFTLPRTPHESTIYITADDYFTLYINGKQADQSTPDPKDTLLWQHVHRRNITSLLRTGKNVIAVKATNAGGTAGVVARVEVEGKPVLLSDNSWKTLDAPSLPADWSAIAFNDTAWSAAHVVGELTAEPWAGAGGLENWPGYDASAPYLAHISLPPLALLDIHNGDGKITADPQAAESFLVTLPKSRATNLNSPELVVDFGKEITGRVEISSPGGQSLAVIVGTGESQEEALKSPWGGTHRLEIAKGKAAHSPYSAFRYAHLSFLAPLASLSSVSSSAQPVTTPAGSIEVHVNVDHKYYPVEYKGSFACSDDLLTKVWYTGAYTAHLGMQEDIWDAPKRDRARWMGDLHVSGAVINLAFADRFLMEQTLQRLRDDAQGGNPVAAGPKQHVNGIPGYSCAWICGLADFHRHIGDYAYLNRQHDALISLLEYCKGDLDSRQVFANQHKAWPFVDWAPEFNQDSPHARAATHLFLVKAIREAVFLLFELGDNARAKSYNAWADSLSDAAQRYLVDPATNTFGDRRQDNAMAIYSGVATKPQTQAIYERVLTPKSPAWNFVATPYYNNYVIYAMSQAGHTSDTLDFIRKYWGGMLAEGATSWWEGYDPRWIKDDFHSHLEADNGTGYFVSLAHGWSSGPTSWLTERILGVRPTAGGFKSVEITPELGDLKWAEGDVPTPQGILHVRVEQSPGGLTIKAHLPKGIAAALSVPGNTQYVTGPQNITIKSPSTEAGR